MLKIWSTVDIVLPPHRIFCIRFEVLDSDETTIPQFPLPHICIAAMSNYLVKIYIKFTVVGRDEQCFSIWLIGGL